MEASHPLAIESFSYSWLLNKRPSLNHEENAEEIISVTDSMRMLMEAEESRNFKFDIPTDSESSVSLVHADEIFSNGQIMPLHLEAFNGSDSSSAQPNFSLAKKDRDYVIRKWKKILQKWLGFLRPFSSKRLGSSRNSAKVDDLNNRNAMEVERRSNSSPPWITRRVSSRKTKSCSNTPLGSPLHSPQNSTDVWRHMETSISEAIIHCKKSFGMLDSA